MTSKSTLSAHSFVFELNTLSREIDAALQARTSHLPRVRNVALASALALGVSLAPAPVLAATFTVDNTTDGNDGSCADGDCSLREAIAAANANPGADTVDASSVSGTITLANDQIEVDDEVTIAGPGSANLTVDASSNSRHFYINETDTAISGLTLANGNEAGNGGAIDVDDAALSLSDVVAKYNYAAEDGGAVHIYGDSGSLEVTDSTFSGNQANGDGGAIFIYNEVDPLLLNITDSTFTDNAASQGGAIAAVSYGPIVEVPIVGSTFSYNVADMQGGATFIRGANLTLTDTEVSNNEATTGGGVYSYYGDATLINSQVSNNVSASESGGLHVQLGDVALTNSTVSGNLAEDGVGGGFLAQLGDVTLTNSTVSGNTVTLLGGAKRALEDTARDDGTTKGIAATGAGGGFLAQLGNVTLTNSTVSGNTAAGTGGGFHAQLGDVALTNSTVSGNTADGAGGGFSATSGNVTLTASTISGNTADGEGGGFYGNSGIVTLTNSTISGNDSFYQGGGFYVNIGDVTVAHSTVSNNDADDSDGVGFYVNSGDVSLNNSILADNNGSGFYINLGVITAEYSLVENNGDPALTGANGNIIGVDPGLGPLQNNGGPTQTQAIDDTSAAYNAGDPNFAPPPDFDQRGGGFPRVVQGRLDMGAYEVQDGQPPPAAVTVESLTLSVSNVQEDNPSAKSAHSSIITATLSAPATEPVSIALNFTGAANLGADFLIDTNPIVIQPGETQGTSVLTAVDDNQVEGNEPFTAVVQSATGADVPDPPPQAQGTIIDDDQAQAAPVVPIPALSPLGLFLLPLLIPVAAWRYLRRSAR